MGANGIANSEDPDHIAPRGAVWSESALFVQNYLSENFASLRYFQNQYLFLVVKKDENKHECQNVHYANMFHGCKKW